MGVAGPLPRKSHDILHTVLYIGHILCTGHIGHHILCTGHIEHHIYTMYRSHRTPHTMYR